MPVSAAARALTLAHRRAQARLGGNVVVRMLDAFKLLDASALEATFPGYVRIVEPIVNGARSASSRLAANYLTTHRAVEVGVDVARLAPTLAEAVPGAQLATSLFVTGPVSLRANLARGMVYERAVDIASARTAAAAARLAIAGGRETIADTIARDALAVGWQRVASETACDFCQELATGITFKGGDAEAVYAYHDGCMCTIEPVYDEDL